MHFCHSVCQTLHFRVIRRESCRGWGRSRRSLSRSRVLPSCGRCDDAANMVVPAIQVRNFRDRTLASMISTFGPEVSIDKPAFFRPRSNLGPLSDYLKMKNYSMMYVSPLVFTDPQSSTSISLSSKYWRILLIKTDRALAARLAVHQVDYKASSQNL